MSESSKNTISRTAMAIAVLSLISFHLVGRYDNPNAGLLLRKVGQEHIL